MEERIKSRYSPEILAEATRRYGVSGDALEELDGFESFIYAFKKGSQKYILRIGHSLRRSEALIRGEVDWINYLVEGGVSASQVIRSENGNLVEAVEDGSGGAFFGTAFRYAPGIPAWEYGWSDTIYRMMGITLGRMHRLTKAYQPRDPLADRPHWDDPIMLLDPDWLPECEGFVQDKYNQVLEKCNSLGKSKQSYGLIHFDMHGGNFFIDEDGCIHPFDFDDCTYNWFANDIAVVLFYMVLNKEDPSAFALHFMDQFIEGYQLENNFERDWLDQLPLFMKMREIELYGIIHRSFDVATMDDEWNLRYMAGRKEKIEKDVPFVETDFRVLKNVLSD